MMKRFFHIAVLSVLLFAACAPDDIVLPWDPVTPVNPENPDEPATPDNPDKPGPTPPEPEINGKPRYVWIDASANFQYFANDAGRIANDMQRISDAGFTDVIVDVRPTEGTVLFRSATAPATGRLAAWVGSSYKFINRTASFDYLQAFVDAGHAFGLRVNAAMNTFVGGYGGYYGLESEGPIFTGDIPESWATTVSNRDGLASSFNPKGSGTVFLNPASDDVQNYMLSLIAELAAYDIDGIILDRCRYDDTGLRSDFSDESKARFADYLGKQPSRWPVFDAGAEDLPITLSAEQKSWMSFRAKTIHDFIERAASTVHSVNPDVRFGVYVGAWYSSYYSSGVNWASPKYQTHKFYSRWADSDYQNYGFADHCDFMMLGCYAAASSIYGTGEWTMEGFCKNAQSLLSGDTVFAGGPDIGNPTGWTNGDQGNKIPKTIDACINNADGYFVFDLCHIRMYDYWSDFRKGFDNYLKSL